MTGWRMGWLVAPPALGDAIENIIQYNTSGVPVFLQRGCIAALEEGDAFFQQLAEVRTARDLVCERLLASERITLTPPKGAFYLFFGIDGEPKSRELALRLIDEANVGFAPGSAFGTGGEGYLRLCFAGTHQRLDEAMGRMLDWLGS